MFRRAISPNHNARNTAFVPGDRLLSGGLRHLPFRVLPARQCTQGAQTYGAPHEMHQLAIELMAPAEKSGLSAPAIGKLFMPD